MRAHEAGWAHAAVSVRGPSWLSQPGDINALVPQLWSQTARKTDGVLEVGGVPLTDLVAEHGSPAYVLDEAGLPRPGACVPRGLRRVGRLLRRQGLPVHERGPLDRRGGAQPRRLLGRGARGGRACRVPDGARRLPRQQQDACRARGRRAARGRPDHRRLVPGDRAAGTCGRGRVDDGSGDGPGHRRGRGAHPRVHRHRPRGPEVRLLHQQRGRPRSGPSDPRGAGARAARPALPHRVADLRLLRVRGRRPAGARAARSRSPPRWVWRCPSWTSVAASGSPTPPRTTRRTPRSWPPR